LVPFDRDAFRRALNASLRERLPQMSRPGQADWIVYQGQTDLVRIARGIAVACKRDATVVELRSPPWRVREAAAAVNPLLHGRVLVLVHSGASEILRDLVRRWPRFVERPQDDWPEMFFKVMVRAHDVEAPGAVIALQDQVIQLRSDDPFPVMLGEAEAQELASLADDSLSLVTIGRSAPTPLEDDQQAYREYRALVAELKGIGLEALAAEYLGRRLILGHDPASIEPEFAASGVAQEWLEDNFERMRSLAEHCQNLGQPLPDGRPCGGFHQDQPLPDVYAAALVVSRAWMPQLSDAMVYRGQRDASWPVVPSFYRKNADGTAPDLDARSKRLGRFVRLLQRRIQVEDRQGLAVAQHVSKEAGTPTWLIDVTRDPFVALFFASAGGQTSDVGIIDRIDLDEWREHVSSNENLAGAPIAVEVSVVERLRRQHGLFLSAPRADLYERYTPHRIFFRQQSNLVFEDDSRDTPISAPWLLPPEPELDALVASLDAESGSEPDEPLAPLNPPDDPGRPLTADMLLGTLADQDGVADLDGYHRLMLEIGCELYAHPERWIEKDDAGKYATFRLRELVLRLVGRQRQGRHCDLAQALEWTKSRLSEAEFGALLEAGYSLWFQRRCVPAAVVVREMQRAVADVSLVAPTSLGVAIPGPSDHAGTVLRGIAEATGARVHDLRSASVAGTLDAMPSLVDGGLVVALVNPDLQPHPLRTLADALYGHRARFSVGDRTFEITSDTVVVFIFAAQRSFDRIEANDSIPYAVNVDDLAESAVDPTG
jgi:hypothetical protein